jgi:poly(3-hydroxybutyrate) depolymerase
MKSVHPLYEKAGRDARRSKIVIAPARNPGAPGIGSRHSQRIETAVDELHRLTETQGPNETSYVDPAFPDRPLTLFSYKPRGFTPETPVLFSHHGRGRNGADYRDYFGAAADELGFFVVAPQFSNEAFPGPRCYNHGNLRDAEGRPNPPDTCSYAIVERLFAALRKAGVMTTRGYALFGHSAGSQFVHRMLTFGYRDHVAAAVAANAGTYSMPDLGVDFPHSLGGTRLGERELRAMLEFPLIVMAGTEDIDTHAPFFPNDAASMRQGATRHERAHRYVEAGEAAARRLGTRCAWSIIDVPGVAHDGARMAAAAAPVLAEVLRGRPARPEAAHAPSPATRQAG